MSLHAGGLKSEKHLLSGEQQIFFLLFRHSMPDMQNAVNAVSLLSTAVFIISSIAALVLVEKRSLSLDDLPLLFDIKGDFIETAKINLQETFAASMTGMDIPGMRNCKLTTSIKSSIVGEIKFTVICTTQRVSSTTSSTTDISAIVCMESGAIPSKGPVIILDSLKFALKDDIKFSCPRSKQLISLHHTIGRKIGAQKSELVDVSRLSIFRDEDVAGKRVRSIVLLTLLNHDPPSGDVQSFYTQFGYRMINDPEKRDAINAAACFIHQVDVENILLQLQSGDERASMIQKTLTKVFLETKSKMNSGKTSSVTLSALVRVLHSSSMKEDRNDLVQLLTGMFNISPTLIFDQHFPACKTNNGLAGGGQIESNCMFNALLLLNSREELLMTRSI